MKVSTLKKIIIDLKHKGFKKEQIEMVVDSIINIYGDD